jgi:Rod binding domain-containing protein
MGMLEELLRQLEEAADQHRNQPLPGTPRSAPRPPPASTPAPRTEEMRREAHQRQRQGARNKPLAQAAEPREAEQVMVEVGEDPVHRLVADSIPAVVESSRRREHPLMARLRQHGGMRDAVVLAEILRRPGRR